MLARLLTGILGIVLTALGVPFTIIGLVGDDAFLAPGIPILAVGLVLLATCAALFRVEAARSRKRREGRRAQAEITAVRLHPGIRIGAMLTVDLSVRIPSVPGGPFTRRVLLPPTLAVGPGDEIEVLFDPSDPANFEPAVTAEHRLR
jgi:hypothetical protein